MMAEMWIGEDWRAELKCACQSVRDSLRVGVSFPELVDWFYDDMTVPCSDDWDDCVLRSRWDTHTWRGVFEAWDECGRPEYDPSAWWVDDSVPEYRRSAQGNARLDVVGEMVYEAFPEALEWAAQALGWTVMDGSFFPDGQFPDGALALDVDGLEAAAGRWYVPVLIPPAAAA